MNSSSSSLNASSSTFQQSNINSSALNNHQQANGLNSPYLDYNTSYSNSILNQSSQTPPCTVPNMFTAAAVAAASSGALHSQPGGTSKSSNLNANNNNQNSEFAFNNNLNKKYLNTQPQQQSNILDSNLQSSSNSINANNLATSGLESSLDQAMFYGSSNGGLPPSLNKSNTLQSSLSKPHQTPEFSTSLTNNYANFAPNSNAAYWHPGNLVFFLIFNYNLFSFLFPFPSLSL